MLSVIAIYWLEPETDPSFLSVTIVERGTSRSDEESAARSEPAILIELPDGTRRSLPSLYYALHTERSTACLHQATTRYSGIDKSRLVPPENCP